MKNIFLSLLILISAVTINSCNKKNKNIPLPAYTNQPKTVALHWSAPQKIRFYDTSKLIVTSKKLDFKALPEEAYDSSVAQPFSKEPIVRHFNWDSLPHKTFNYDSLPSQPLHFKTFIVKPEIIKAGPLVFKQLTSQPIFEIANAADIFPKMIVSTLEDKAGFIWIASLDGLYRYDGQNLVRYLKTGLFTRQLKEDDKGQIWMMPYNASTRKYGIYVLNTHKNILQQLSAQDMECTKIFSMLPHGNGKIWVATDSGIRIIDINKNLFKSFSQKQGLSADTAFSLLEDEEKNIWVSTYNGLNIINEKQTGITYFKRENGLVSDSILGLKEDKEKRIWTTDPRMELHVIDRHNANIISLDRETVNLKSSLQNSSLANMMADDKGNMLIDYAYLNSGNTYTHDLNLINLKNSTTRQIQFPEKYGFILSSLLDKYGQTWLSRLYGGLFILNKNGYHIHHAGNTNITSLAEDSRNNIWIASVNEGIRILNPVTGKAKILNKATGLSDDTLNDVECIKGIIYVGTLSGLDIIDSNYTTITHIGNMVLASHAFYRGNTWLLDWKAHRIEAFNPGKKIRFHVDVSGNQQDTVMESMIQDKERNISFFTRSGLLGEIDSGSGYIRYADSTIFLRNHTNHLLCSDKSGNTWVGDDTVLYRINKRRDSGMMFTPQNGLFNSTIRSLIEYNGCIYAGSGMGVNIVNPPNAATNNTWCIQSLGKQGGFSTNFGQNQSDGVTHYGTYLWVGNGGITFLPFHFINKSVRPETYITGIDVYNQPQYFSSKPGNFTVTEDTLWDENTGKYYLKGQKLNTASDVYQNKMEWDSTYGEYNLPANLRLSYNENIIRFNFVQSNEGSQDAEYRYFLEGYDTTWSKETSNTSSNNYFDLPNGSYTFKVTSLYNNRWSNPVEFNFTIARPWWKTWWAFVIYFVLLGLVVVAIRSINLNRRNKLLEVKVNQRTAQLNRSLEELKAAQSQLIQSEKMASLGELTAGIAHEIQNPLNFVNNFSEVNNELIDELKNELANGNGQMAIEIADDIKNNGEKISHHGKRADAIVKSMLEHSRTSTGVKGPTDLNKLVDEYLRLSYHGMRAKDKNFNAHIETDFDNSISKINIVSQDIGRVLLNLFNNAFYAITQRQQEEGKEFKPTVSVKTKKSGNSVAITVSDNGSGIPESIKEKIFQPFFTTKPTGQGTGLGLSLSYDIVKAHGGELKVESKEGEGTTFIIQLPFTNID